MQRKRARSEKRISFHLRTTSPCNTYNCHQGGKIKLENKKSKQQKKPPEVGLHEPRAFRPLFSTPSLCFNSFPRLCLVSHIPTVSAHPMHTLQLLDPDGQSYQSWPFTVLGGDQTRPRCGSLTTTCITKFFYKTTLGPNFSREKLLPLVPLCLQTVTLCGASASWNGPWLHDTTVKHNVRTKHVYWTQEDEQ